MRDDVALEDGGEGRHRAAHARHAHDVAHHRRQVRKLPLERVAAQLVRHVVRREEVDHQRRDVLRRRRVQARSQSLQEIAGLRVHVRRQLQQQLRHALQHRRRLRARQDAQQRRRQVRGARLLLLRRQHRRDELERPQQKRVRRHARDAAAGPHLRHHLQGRRRLLEEGRQQSGGEGCARGIVLGGHGQPVEAVRQHVAHRLLGEARRPREVGLRHARQQAEVRHLRAVLRLRRRDGGRHARHVGGAAQRLAQLRAAQRGGHVLAHGAHDRHKRLRRAARAQRHQAHHDASVDHAPLRVRRRRGGPLRALREHVGEGGAQRVARGARLGQLRRHALDGVAAQAQAEERQRAAAGGAEQLLQPREVLLAALLVGRAQQQRRHEDGQHGVVPRKRRGARLLRLGGEAGERVGDQRRHGGRRLRRVLRGERGDGGQGGVEVHHVADGGVAEQRRQHLRVLLQVQHAHKQAAHVARRAALRVRELLQDLRGRQVAHRRLVVQARHRERVHVRPVRHHDAAVAGGAARRGELAAQPVEEHLLLVARHALQHVLQRGVEALAVVALQLAQHLRQHLAALRAGGDGVEARHGQLRREPLRQVDVGQDVREGRHAASARLDRVLQHLVQQDRQEGAALGRVLQRLEVRGQAVPRLVQQRTLLLRLQHDVVGQLRRHEGQHLQHVLRRNARRAVARLRHQVQQLAEDGDADVACERRGREQGRQRGVPGRLRVERRALSHELLRRRQHDGHELVGGAPRTLLELGDELDDERVVQAEEGRVRRLALGRVLRPLADLRQQALVVLRVLHQQRARQRASRALEGPEEGPARVAQGQQLHHAREEEVVVVRHDGPQHALRQHNVHLVVPQQVLERLVRTAGEEVRRHQPQEQLQLVVHVARLLGRHQRTLRLEAALVEEGGEEVVEARVQLRQALQAAHTDLLALAGADLLGDLVLEEERRDLAEAGLLPMPAGKLCKLLLQRRRDHL
eukprot:Rhum_TRINITY_DN11810_c0_g1::Rhum_TRINITY_DN11810_c0_g1_i1::g.47205::m.47205